MKTPDTASTAPTPPPEALQERIATASPLHANTLRALGEWLESNTGVRAFARVDRLARQAADTPALLDPSGRDGRLRPLSLLILRSITTEPLSPMLRSWGLVHGLALDVTHGAFGQVEQELMGTPPQGTDALLLWGRLEELAPALAFRFATLAPDARDAMRDELVDRLIGWLDHARRACPKGPILMMGLALPAHPAYGLADRRLDGGQRACVQAINDALERACRQRNDTHLVDLDMLLSRVGQSASFDQRMEAHARQPFTPAALSAVSRHVARMLSAATTARRKCIVVDCDNTLWGGILGEDGPEGIAIGPEYPGRHWARFQESLLELQRCGIILAISSKNNEADVLSLLDEHPHQVLRRQHFAAWRISWGDKATAIAELAEELNIGLDSMVFLDDSSFECELVSSRLPQVLTVQVPGDPTRLNTLLHSLAPLDFLDLSEEDRRRGDMYREQVSRERSRQTFASIEEFYHSLSMRLAIAPVEHEHVDRVSQLTRRTNQFNLTTRRYAPGDIEAFREDPARHAFLLRLDDRFGSYGVCGTLLLAETDKVLVVDTLLLSCRVLGRGIEAAVFHFLDRFAGSRGLDAIAGTYLPTARNGQVADLFPRFGFRPAGDLDDNGTAWRRDAEDFGTPAPAWLTLDLPDLSD